LAVLRINHVQIAMPQGQEEAARRFYGGVLGLSELPKPSRLAARGGAWFALAGAQLHLGVDADFRAAKKAHVAFDVEELDALAERCRASGHAPRPDEEIDGRRRFFVDDPFGNRVEVIEARPAARGKGSGDPA